MKKFKKGDRVECATYGPGEVVRAYNSAETNYPVKVLLDSGRYYGYTIDGRFYKGDPATLSHAEKPKYFKSPLETGIKTSLILAVCGVVGIIYAAYRAVIYFFF